MKSSAELEQEIKRYKAFAKKKIARLTASWLRAIQYEEEHPSPEVSAQEAIMAARIQKFNNHKWESGETCYKARYSFIDGALIVGKYQVEHVVDNMLTTSRQGLSFQEAEISFDDLAAIALLYFKTKDMSIPDDKIFRGAGKITRYQFRRYVREWFFEAKANLEAKHESS